METLECLLCNFTTSRSHDMKRHNESKKHIERLHKQLPEFPDKQPKISIKLQKNLKNELKIANNANNFANNANIITQNTQQKQFKLIQNEVCIEIEKKPTKVTNKCNCGKQFSHSSSLSRHKKTCDETQLTIQENKYIEKIDNLEKQLAKMQTFIEKIPTSIIAFNKPETIGNIINANHIITDNSVNIDNSIKTITDNSVKNVSVITYLNNNYTDAKPLKMLKSKDVTKMFSGEDIGNYSIEEIITFQQSKYMLDEFLGDVIIKKFTNTTNPKQQQIWISDVARLKFIVRGITNKDQSAWHPDKKGIILTDKIITPMLDDVRTLMTKHNKSCSVNIKNSDFEDQYDWLYKQSTHAVSVIYDINQKILHHKILLHIAPHFQLVMDD